MRTDVTAALGEILGTLHFTGGFPPKILLGGEPAQDLLSLLPPFSDAEKWYLACNNGRESKGLAEGCIIWGGHPGEAIQKLPDYYFDLIVITEQSDFWFSPFSNLSELKFKLNQDGVLIAVGQNMRNISTITEIISGEWTPASFLRGRMNHSFLGVRNSFLQLFSETGFTVQSIVPVQINEVITPDGLIHSEIFREEEFSLSHFIFSCNPANNAYRDFPEDRFTSFIEERFPVIMNHFKSRNAAEALSLTTDTIDILKRCKKSGLEPLLEKFESLKIKLRTLQSRR